jgi:nucleoside-diphosphate-sugar epimerase
LLTLGYDVIGVDCFVDYYPRAIKERNLARARSHERFRFIEGDLGVLNLPEILSGVDYVFHQAAQAGVRASWGDYFSSYCAHNIVATQRLLDAVRANGAVKKVVYASSSSIYGNAEKFPTPESVRPQPVSPYGVTKLAAEHLMSLYASEFKVPTVSLRYFTVFGPRQRPDMAFNRFIRAALQGKELTLYGDGEQSRDFTFIDDIVAANILAAERGEPGSVFNVGGGTQATVLQIFELLRSEVGALNIRREERQAGDARHTGADCTKIRAELGFTPKVSLAEGIAREVAWMRDELRAPESPV